jgi:hypothetical protein
MESFKLLDIAPPTKKYKKYAAKVMLPTGITKIINFGDSRYEQYKDRTRLKLYKHLDHLDDKRRENYRKRHSKNMGIASQLAMNYLW